MIDTGPALIGNAQSGKLRLLAVASEKRNAAVPDVPTMAEAGMGDFVAPAWISIMAPAKTPKPVIDKLAGDTIAFHIKDIAPAGTAEEDGWADVGHGTIDWKALWPHIAKAPKAGILVAEHDNPADWKRFAERSFASIKALVS